MAVNRLSGAGVTWNFRPKYSTPGGRRNQRLADAAGIQPETGLAGSCCSACTIFSAARACASMLTFDTKA